MKALNLQNLFLGIMCSLPVISFSQDTIPTWSPATSRKNNHFLIGLEVETSKGLKGGFSLGYLRKLDKNHKYLLGLTLKGFIKNNSRSIQVYYNGFDTRDGTLEHSVMITNFMLSLKYLPHHEYQKTPFISFDFGARFVESEISTYFYYYSGFPFGWLPNGDYATVDSTRSIYINIEGGYWINLIRDTGIYIKAGLGFSKQFEIIDEDSVAYDTQGIHYSTYYSNPVFVTIGIGTFL